MAVDTGLCLQYLIAFGGQTMIRGALGIERLSYFRPYIQESISNAIYIKPNGVLLALSLPYMCAPTMWCSSEQTSRTKRERNMAEVGRDPNTIPTWGMLLDRILPKPLPQPKAESSEPQKVDAPKVIGRWAMR